MVGAKEIRPLSHQRLDGLDIDSLDVKTRAPETFQIEAERPDRKEIHVTQAVVCSCTLVVIETFPKRYVSWIGNHKPTCRGLHKLDSPVNKPRVGGRVGVIDVARLQQDVSSAAHKLPPGTERRAQIIIQVNGVG